MRGGAGSLGRALADATGRRLEIILPDCARIGLFGMGCSQLLPPAAARRGPAVRRDLGVQGRGVPTGRPCKAAGLGREADSPLRRRSRSAPVPRAKRWRAGDKDGYAPQSKSRVADVRKACGDGDWRGTPGVNPSAADSLALRAVARSGAAKQVRRARRRRP